MNRFLLLLVSFGATAMCAAADTLPVFDKDFQCTSQAKAQQYVADFGIDVQSFGGVELCDSTVDAKKLFNDLELIEEGRFQGSQVNVFIHNFVPVNTYYPWMHSETRGMNRGNDIPYATAYNSGGTFTMQDGWAKLSTLGRVGTVIHEARHTEGYGHRVCTHGPYQDSRVSGCDQSVAESGAHAIEMEYYARVALQGANFHPVYQSMARLMLLARANFVFNDNPMIERESLLALTPDGLVRLKDGQVENLALLPSEAVGSALKRTSFGATLFQLPGTAWALDVLEPKPQAELSDDYSYFKLLRMTPPSGLNDMEEFEQGTRRYLFAASNQNQLLSYTFAQGEWSTPSPIAGLAKFQTVAPDGREGIFAQLTSGNYCALDTATLNCTGAAQPWPATSKSFVKYKNDTLALGIDGVVRKSDGSPLSELQNLKVLDVVSIPQYNAFE